MCPGGPPKCGYATIRDATAAANAGDTILIAAGSYSEYLMLSTSLTLAGIGQGGAAIDRAVVALKNTILAGNSADYSDPDCEGSLTSEDSNLIQNTTGCTISGGGHDLIGLAANLGPLQSNGGPTLTMALLAGSPAIDAGNPAGCTSPGGNLLRADQRVYPRPSPRGGRCDIGAFELQQ